MACTADGGSHYDNGSSDAQVTELWLPRTKFASNAIAARFAHNRMCCSHTRTAAVDRSFLKQNSLVSTQQIWCGVLLIVQICFA